MGMKLFVGSMGYDVNDRELSEVFSRFGTVQSAVVINDRETGRSKGFGFVEMSTQSEGMAAIDGLNGKEIGGRNVTVNEARPREDRPRDDRGPRRSFDNQSRGGRR